ncbi:MAG: S9 family peptidase, partial [Planctomycetota bacterium]
MAATRRKMTVEDLFRLRIVSRAAISPDGTKVAVAVKRCDLKKNKNFMSLFLVSTGGGRLRRITTGDHSDTMPKWSPDGKFLAFISDRDKASCIWLLPMDGGEATRLTDRDHDVVDYNFSPDGRRIVYSAREKSERDRLRRDDKKKTLETTPDFVHITRLFHKLDGAGFWNGHYVHIYSINTRGGSLKQLTRGHWDHKSPQFSPDGRRVAFLSNRTPDPDRQIENMDIFTVTANGGRAKQITKREGPILDYSWSPDGREFAYVGHEGKTGEFSMYNVHVWTIPANGGRPRNLTADIDNSCFNATLSDVADVTFEADPPVWSSDGNRVYFVVSEGGACNIHEACTQGSGSRPRLVGHHVIAGLSRTTNTGPVVFVLGAQTNPGDVFTLDIDDAHAQPRQITHVNRAVLNGLALSQPEPLSVKRAGRTVHGWVMKPPGFSAKRGGKRRYPLVLQIHGGPYAQYGHGFFHEFQWLAARGYVVLFTNPSGSMGCGLKHVTRLCHDWGGPCNMLQSTAHTAGGIGEQ